VTYLLIADVSTDTLDAFRVDERRLWSTDGYSEINFPHFPQTDLIARRL